MAFNFGGQKPAGTSGSTTPTFGGFGAAANTQAGSSTGAAPAAPAPSGFSFGGLSNNTANSATPKPAFSFASANNTSNPTATPAAKPTFGFGTAAAGSTTPASSPAPTTFAGFGNTTGASTASSSNAAPSFSFASLNKDKPAATPAASGSGLFAGLQNNAAAGSTTPASKPPPTTFSFGKPPANPLAPAAPASSTTPAAAPTPPASGGFSFGAKPAAENKDNASTPAQPAAPSASAAAPTPFGAFKLGSSTTTPAASGTATPPAAPATGGFSFGAKPAEAAKPADSANKPSTPGAASSTPAPAAQSSGGFSFGKPAASTTTAPATSGTATPAASTSTPASEPAKPAAGGFSFGGLSSSAAPTAGTSTTPAAGTSTNSTALAASTTTASTSKVAVPVPSLLKGLTLEEILNRWSTDLDDRVRAFVNLSAEVKNWDNLLIRNGDEISKLYNNLQALDPVSKTIDESLDYIENQQKEMNNVLGGYESMLDELLQGRNNASNSAMGLSGNSSYNSASEREKAYILAEELNTQLDDLSRSLASLINEVNSLSSSSSSALVSSASQEPNPVQSITAILNAHLSSLNWIEKQSDTLSDQIAELEERMKNVSGGKWTGLSPHGQANKNSLVARNSGTPRREGTPSSSAFGHSRSAFGASPNNGSGTPTRFGASTTVIGTPGRSGTPSRLGQSSLGRSGVYGLGSRR